MAKSGFLGLVELNPFPKEDPHYEAYVAWASTVGEAQARLQADLTERVFKTSESEQSDLVIDAAVEVFDLWAGAVAPMASRQHLETHFEYLDGTADWIFTEFTSRASIFRSQAGNLVLLRARLDGRKAHWIAEALKLARESAPQRTAAAARAGERSTAESAVALDRRAAVDAYLAEASNSRGKPVTRTDFWKSAGYRSRTEFERWQRADERTTDASRKTFERILREKPHCQ